MSPARALPIAAVVLVFALGFGAGRLRAPGAVAPTNEEPARDPEAWSATAASEAPRLLARRVRSMDPNTPVEAADSVRQLVYDNSEHGGRENDLETDEAVARLWGHLEAGHEAPRLSCGPRALAMQAVLDELGIESRIVHVFSDDFDSVRSHTFVEIRDPASGEWQIQDPDMNAFYVDKGSRLRVAAERLLLFPRTDFEPCAGPDDCGWGDKTKRLRDHYFEAVMYDRRRSRDSTTILVNTARMSISKPFEKNDALDFLAFAYDRYANPAVGRGRSAYWPTLVLRRGSD